MLKYSFRLLNAFILIGLFSFSCLLSQENHLANIKQLTFGGDNAEAYFSPDGTKLILQVTNPEIGAECDQIYLLDLNKENYSAKDLKLVSTGKGRTTCSFFMPDNKHIIYASTHEGNSACPPKPAPRADGKYVWPIYSDFDIYEADLQGNIVKKLTQTPGYDAEAVVSPDGKKIAFTSMRSGDLEIYTMNLDGTNVKQITNELGYDGGAFFTHDSKHLIFRASRPKTQEEIKTYKDLLKENLVMPTAMELFMVDIDGKNLKQLTHLGKANWSPYMHPSDDKVLFSSNHHATRGYDFQIYELDLKTQEIEQITYESIFNAFPMFSPDGKKLVFSSNRNGVGHDTNVFIADWVEGDSAENVSTENLKKHLKFLSSDDLKGRLTGSPGEAKAAAYIEKEFKTLGLGTFLSDSYEHPFEYKVRLNPHNSDESLQNSGKNVVAFLDNKSDKTILIGAHYDHLGLNEHHNSTLPNSEGMIHNGADDNASGVAAVLELARMYSQNLTQEKVNYVFALFSGEEDGLIGSKELAEELAVQKMVPSWAPKSWKSPIVTMVNLDMVGRLNQDKVLTVGGVGTSPKFGELAQKFKPAGVNLAIDSSGIGPSDHTSFYLKNIPVIFLFTGTHEDYHKPTDDYEKLNFTGERTIVNYVFNLSNAIAEEEEIPFQKTKAKTEKVVPKYKVTLGIMPSYADSDSGMKVDGVMDGRPGKKAGLKQGDVITQIGDCQVKEVYSYMKCLSELNEGDTVDLTFLRNGKTITNKVTF